MYKCLIEKSVQNCYNGISSKWLNYCLLANLKGEMFMKLKKLLAAVTAAALAVTTMAVTSFTASAAGSETITTGTFAYTASNWEGKPSYNGFNVCVQTFNEPLNCSDYDAIEMTYEATDWGNAKSVAVYTNGGTLGWDSNSTWSHDVGEKTIRYSFSGKGDKTFAEIGCQVVAPDFQAGTSSESDLAFSGSITIKSITLIEKETIEYAVQNVPVPSDNVFPGTFDSTKINGNNAKIEVTYTASDSNNGIQFQDEAGNTLASISGWGETGDLTKEVLLSDFSSIPSKMKLNAWGISSISSIKIYNDSTKGNVYTEGSVTPDPGEGDPSSYTIAFDSTKELELKVIDASGWGIPAVTKAAQLNVEAIPTGITKGTTTYGELKAATVNLTGVEFKNFSIEGLTADDVSVSLYAKWGSGWSWTSGGQTWNLSTIDNVADDDVLQEMGYQININGDKGGINDMELDAVVKVNSTGGGSEEPEPKPPVTGDAIWEGNTDMGTAWSANVQIPAEKFANIKAGDTLKFTFTKGSADYFQLKFASASEGWPVLSSPEKNEYDSVDLTDSPYSFVVNAADVAALKADGMAINGYGVILTKVELISAGGSEDPKPPVVDPPVNPPVDPDTPSTPDTPVTPPSVGGNSVIMGSTEFNGWYEAVLTKDQLFGSNTGATTITFTGADLAKVGYNSISAGGYKGIDCTGTVTIQVSDIDLSDNFFLHVGGNAATVVTWSFDGGSGGNNPSNPSNPSTPSSGSTYVPPIPSGATSISMVDTIISTGAASLSFNLGSSAKLDKEVFEALASKGDITVRFNVAGGAYWEVNGENVTAAKAVNLGVRMNSNLIPASAVSELAGDKTTIQLSLKHNGDFGFTGVLNVPVGKANDGKFANLYYYHSGKFDFVGSSAISNGRAKFAFSHASNYIIVIDDYAYGEDVSSAAGMTETTETSAVPYVAALVVVSAFAASAVVLKKRLSK